MIPICDVSLYEDRAQISRRALLKLKMGNNSLVLDNLSPAIVLKSVQVVLGDRDAKLNFVETKLYREEDTDPDHTKPENAQERFFKNSLLSLRSSASETY